VVPGVDMASDWIAHKLARNEPRSVPASRRPEVGEAAGARALSAVPHIEDPLTRLGIGLTLVALATLGRLALGAIDPGSAPFVLYFPAILLASFLGGWRVGALAAVASVVVAYVLFAPHEGGLTHPSFVVALNVTLHVVVSAAIVAIAGRVGVLIEELAQSRAALRARTSDYDGLFGMMSEGFAVCDAICDDQGRLIDYVVAQMNPALQRMLGVGPEGVGGKLSAAPGDHSVWLDLCDRVLKSGAPRSFEYHDPQTGRWHEVHINRVTQTRMAQLFLDVTERKAAEEHKARLFEELNHRVKNNVAVVSAILSMQARGADPATRASLVKAVDRVRSIAEVHGSLSHGREAGLVDFAGYLRGLCDRLAESLLADDRIQIVVETVSMDIDAEHAVPLGMAVNELVTNAVKYAYPPPQRGVITVCLNESERGHLLTISDSGCGLPNDAESKTGGLGFSIIQSMVRQVSGTLTIRRHPGTTFEILLPNR
jgi:two-component sensor histidine kinase/PAS domain-containing protein